MSKLLISDNKEKKKKPSRPRVFILEGNIGSGKTTTLSFLRRTYTPEQVEIYEEPVHRWCNLNNDNLLRLYYNDTRRWSFQFQQYSLLTMLQAMRSAAEKPTCAKIRVFERSVYSGKMVFMENLRETNFIDNASYQIYMEWFDYIVNNIRKDNDDDDDDDNAINDGDYNQQKHLQIDLFIYLKESSRVLFERVQQRNRPEEKSITFEYIDNLNKHYNRWLCNINNNNDNSCMYAKETTTSSTIAPVYILDSCQTNNNRYLKYLFDNYIFDE